MEGPFTVITLSQHTENDMSMWSMEVESEREALLETVSCCWLTSTSFGLSNFFIVTSLPGLKETLVNTIQRSTETMMTENIGYI